jgi:NAD(P)-dependent dehydrogenase (short-subunit alcohol dehydrogenase family)
MGDLVDGSALVTGAGSGIGRAIARALAVAGASVALMDVRAGAVDDVAEDIVSAGGNALALNGDVSRWEDIDRAVNDTVRTLGPLGTIVNAAGILDGYSLAEDTSIELWERVIGINLTGTFFGAKRALQEMLPRGEGRIINIASASGLVGDGGGPAYIASKHGVVGLTRRFAVLYGSRGITTNAICPGPVETNLRTNSMEVLGSNSPDMTGVGIGGNPGLIQQLVPAGRRSSPDEIAHAAAFLAHKMSGYINGHTLVIDGGWVAK